MALPPFFVRLSPLPRLFECNNITHPGSLVASRGKVLISPAAPRSPPHLAFGFIVDFLASEAG